MPLRAFNPVSSFRWARGMTIVAALMTVFFIMQLVGQVPAALWVIFGEDRFRWSATMIGLSLAVFGILHALAQAFVTGPATKRFGEKQAIIAGMAANSRAKAKRHAFTLTPSNGAKPFAVWHDSARKRVNSGW